VIDGTQWPKFVAEWATKHKEIDRDGLSDALLWAATYYSGGGLCENDTLNEIAESAAELLKLISDRINRQRIINALVLERYSEITPRSLDMVGEVTAKLDEMFSMLDAVRRAARYPRRARTRGRRAEKQDLRAAYGRLAAFWKRSFGEKKFTQVWTTTKPPEPLSPASYFLYAAMNLIDPSRPRLGEELRDLMQKDISEIPGPRRGRRGS
jgi:hypothetical protein